MGFAQFGYPGIPPVLGACRERSRLLGQLVHPTFQSSRERHCSGYETHRILVPLKIEAPVLSGSHVRLEPLHRRHVDGLVAAAAADRSLYQWSPVPQSRAEAASYVDTALAWQEAGTAVPFATVRLDDGAVIGSTRFFNLEQWSWPQGHQRHGHDLDACEIGYT